MRKIGNVLAGLLLGGAMLTGTPAKADVGCECATWRAGDVRRDRHQSQHQSWRRLHRAMRDGSARPSITTTSIWPKRNRKTAVRSSTGLRRKTETFLLGPARATAGPCPRG